MARAKARVSKRQAAAKKAAATRRRNEKLVAESIAASDAAERARRGAATRRARAAERVRESIAEGERSVAVVRGPGRWLEAIEERTNWNLSVTNPEPAAQTPWAVVGRFDFRESLSYAEVGRALRVLRDDLFLETAIGPQRFAAIRMVYRDPRDVRGSSDSVVSHEGPWELVISEAVAESGTTDDDDAPDYDPDSLAARYDNTAVTHLYVYFGGNVTRSSLRDGYQPAWGRS